MAEQAVTVKKDPTILYLYQPKGVDARAVGKKSFIVKSDQGKIGKITLQRGVNKLDRVGWELIVKTQQGKDLLTDEQLFLVAESTNLIKDFVAGQRTVNGDVTTEKLINNCFNEELVNGWHSYIKTQDLTVGSKLAKLAIQLADRLAKKDSFKTPPASIEPLNPSRAIGYTNQLQAI
jgi:hypothetical protein